jgi:hypothetical protein
MGDGLDLKQDLVFENADCRFQHAMWMVLGAFVLAAVAGLFGSGPLNQGNAESHGGAARLTFERFPHLQTATEWQVDLSHQSPGSTAAVRLEDGCLDDMRSEGVNPDPEASLAQGKGEAFRFRLGPGETTARLHFRFTPERPGGRHCRIIAGSDTLQFHQWVYP